MLDTADGDAELIEATGGTDGCRREGLGGRMASGSIWGGPRMNGLITPDGNINVLAKQHQRPATITVEGAYLASYLKCSSQTSKAFLNLRVILSKTESFTRN